MRTATDAAPRRGLNRVEAAGYVGVGTSKFDDMVKDGRMPRPISIDSRRVWDLRALDAAFDNLSAGFDDPPEIPDSWADLTNGAEN
jgi:predicted DNA-binding transcriptional regulator AlpA